MSHQPHATAAPNVAFPFFIVFAEKFIVPRPFRTMQVLMKDQML